MGINNTDLLVSKERKATGLPEALQKEYKRLLKSGMPKKVVFLNANGEEKEVNNPTFVKALRYFVQKYKTEEEKKSPKL